jgi:signal transduction histidine kinase
MPLETRVSQLDQIISTEGKHSAVIAYLSQLALSRPSPADMFTNVTALISHVLPAGSVLLWELDSGRESLMLRSHSRWKAAATLESQVPLEPHSLEEFVLRSPYPILVHELKTDIRFKPSSFLQASGAISVLAVTAGTVQRPFGIIEAVSQHHHAYSQNDVQFFHSVANILALFMDVKRQETTAAETEKDSREQIPKTQSGSQWDDLQQEQHEIKNRLVESRERERLRLAQELHDIPIQDLYGLMYQVEDLKEIVKNTNGMEILEEFNSTLHRVVNNLRAICGELRPPSLSPFGLEVAIRDHVEKLRSLYPDLRIHLDLMRDQQSLSDSIRLRLFRIYQQAINNVVRHSEASDVHIRFRGDDREVVLEVEDNGIGFEIPERWVDLVRQEHFGLVGIAERAESMQGRLEIDSTPGEGTSIRVSVPRR